jgi:hypothetical protein
MFSLFFGKSKSEKVSESKVDDTIKNDDVLASVSYVVKKDKDSPIIDILIDDYNEESVKALCSLLLILSDDRCFIDTINIVKQLLIDDGKTDILIKIFSQIHNKIKEKSEDIQYKKNQPCVKPSEMFNT